MKKNNHVKYAIMGVITTGCRTGYDIKQFIDQSLNHFWKISYGQIYPTLKQLVVEGLATVKNTSQTGKPDKKEYFLTEIGSKELRVWLEQPIQDMPFERNEVLLKLFFSRHQSNNNIIQQLREYKEKLQEHYQTYVMIEEMISTNLNEQEDARYWLFTLDYGKRVTTSGIAWCESTMEKIQEGY